MLLRKKKRLPPPRRILFVCTGNCVRSQMAEALLNYRGAGRYEAHSAGAWPAGFVHGAALEVLHEIGAPTVSLRSKSWTEFANQRFDAVVTLCGWARDHLCKHWPEESPRRGHVALPLRSHWPVADPTHLSGITPAQHIEAFRATRNRIRELVEMLVLLRPEEAEDDRRLAEAMGEIAQAARDLPQDFQEALTKED